MDWQGTAKQIAYAKDIRDKMIVRWSFLETSKEPDDKKFQEYWAIIKQVISAKFWIEQNFAMKDDLGLEFLVKHRLQDYC